MKLTVVILFSGFVLVRPTSASIELYRTAWKLYVMFHKAHDQVYLNLAIQQLTNEHSAGLKIERLPVKLFQCGVYYFEHRHIMFYNKPQCSECVMVHNNYIGSVAAKVTQIIFWFILSSSS